MPNGVTEVRRYKLAYLTNIPSPYRREMILAWATENPFLEVSVFYTDADDQGRGWHVQTVGSLASEARLPIVLGTSKYGKLNRGLRRIVSDHDIIMIGGFEQPSYLVAALWAKVLGKPVILLFDGFSPARFGRESRPILALKRLTARLARGYFANGTVGARYLTEQMHVPRHRPLRNQYLSHFNPAIAADAEDAASRRAALRNTLKIPDDRIVLLSCGYLIERKRVDLTIDAIAALAPADRPDLIVAGTGPLSDVLERHARNAGVVAHFVGFREAAALADLYLASDAMVLASRDDPWGLVVNEAMDAGLPVIVSDACGAALDLVAEETNGFVFRSGDIAALSEAIAKLLKSDMKAMGRQSRRLIAGWTALQSAQTLGELAREVLGSARRQGNDR